MHRAHSMPPPGPVTPGTGGPNQRAGTREREPVMQENSHVAAISSEGSMGRHRKPTHLLVVSGGARNHPERLRARAGEPEHDGTDLRDVEPPAHLDATHAAVWRDLRDTLHEHVAMHGDGLAFEVLVRLVVILRSGEASAAHMTRLQAMLGEFGLTPASRSRVIASPPKTANPFAQFTRTEA